ncbi:MAG: hypothetical protein B7Y37_09840 [Sphingobacteriia bacterium 28-36-52]|nr:MAG: hypothetical protein B7Y37_09840 [Sphingobacteriia bacterium 28-36-52]
MYKYFLSLFSLLILNSCKSNPKFPLIKKKYLTDTIVFHVLNKDSMPVDLASAVYLNRKVGSYSNNQGKIVLPFISNDSIKISSLGFKDTIIDPKSFSFTKRVFLQAKPTILPEVYVKNYTLLPQFENLGFYNDLSKNFCINQYGSQIAVLINNNNKKGVLNQIQIKHQKTTYESYLRIHIYDNVSLGNLPGSDIIDTVIICKVVPRSKKTIIDFSSTRINVSNMIFHIGIDFLGKKNFIDGMYLNYNKQPVEPFILLTDKYTEEQTAINFMSKKWSKYFVLNDPNGVKKITNAIVSCRIQRIK